MARTYHDRLNKVSEVLKDSLRNHYSNTQIHSIHLQCQEVINLITPKNIHPYIPDKPFWQLKEPNIDTFLTAGINKKEELDNIHILK